jgi:fatty acid desaturase
MLAATGLIAVQWSLEKPHFILVVIAMSMAYGLGCILHNHAHVPMWHNKTLNRLTDYWLIMLRGDGVYSWLPTHVKNHHHYANQPGDLTLTHRFGEANTFIEFMRYSVFSGYLYAREIALFIKQAWQVKRKFFVHILLQIIVHVSFVGTLLYIDPVKCFWFVILPQAWGILLMVSTGYFQHHLADEKSPVNFSRNFVGKWTNLLHFNHGYHSVHHVDPRSHWTQWPVMHAEFSKKMDPRLNESNLFWYIFRIFVLAPLAPKFAAHNFRKNYPPVI